MKNLAATVAVGLLSLLAPLAMAADVPVKSVAAVHQEKSSLAGKSVSVQGKVVKVNNGIMGRNFVHLQDGTGDASSNNLIVTSKDTAQVGQQVLVTGKVTVNRDFGAGYMYPLLLEESSISAK